MRTARGLAARSARPADAAREKAIVEPSDAVRLIYLDAGLSETEAGDITAESPAWLSIA